MPSVYGQLVDQGVLFKRAYVNTSLCCPSRAQILTGLYEHHTGVDANEVALDRPTFPQALHDSGYRTMLAGKYLNSWPCDPRAEYDQWVCVGTPEPSTYSLVDPMHERERRVAALHRLPARHPGRDGIGLHPGRRRRINRSS